jgi:hypothetical protein
MSKSKYSQNAKGEPSWRKTNHSEKPPNQSGHAQLKTPPREAAGDSQPKSWQSEGGFKAYRKIAFGDRHLTRRRCSVTAEQMGGRNRWAQLGNRKGNNTSGVMNDSEELIEEVL